MWRCLVKLWLFISRKAISRYHRWDLVPHHANPWKGSNSTKLEENIFHMRRPSHLEMIPWQTRCAATSSSRTKFRCWALTGHHQPKAGEKLNATSWQVSSISYSLSSLPLVPQKICLMNIMWKFPSSARYSVFTILNQLVLKHRSWGFPALHSPDSP